MCEAPARVWDIVDKGRIEEGMLADLVLLDGLPDKAFRVRTVIKDDNVLLAAPLIMTLEQSLEFIEDDELVEVTPETIRVRKLHLKEHERKTASRQAKKQLS